MRLILRRRCAIKPVFLTENGNLCLQTAAESCLPLALQGGRAAGFGPARVYGIAGKGRIAAGYDADLTLVDLKRRQRITDASTVSRVGWTPYDGTEVTGWPVGTVVRGRRVMWEGALIAKAQGECIRFGETLVF